MYAVTMTGTTGKSAEVPDDVLDYMDRVKRCSTVPSAPDSVFVLVHKSRALRRTWTASSLVLRWSRHWSAARMLGPFWPPFARVGASPRGVSLEVGS